MLGFILQPNLHLLLGCVSGCVTHHDSQYNSVKGEGGKVAKKRVHPNFAKIPVEKEIVATQTKPAEAGSIESAQGDLVFIAPDF